MNAQLSEKAKRKTNLPPERKKKTKTTKDIKSKQTNKKRKTWLQAFYANIAWIAHEILHIQTPVSTSQVMRYLLFTRM